MGLAACFRGQFSVGTWQWTDSIPLFGRRGIGCVVALWVVGGEEGDLVEGLLVGVVFLVF